MLSRGLMHRRCKTRIAATAATAAGDDEFLIGRRKFESLLTGLIVVDDSPDRNLQPHIGAFAAGLVGSFSVPSALGGVLGIEAEMHQRVVALAGFHDRSEEHTS